MKIRHQLYILLLATFISCKEAPKLEGYTSQVSYFPNENIEVFLNSEEEKTTDLSLYDINGNEVDVVNSTVFRQPEVDTNLWYKIGYQYKKTFDYSPFKLKSGIYYFENSSPFIIKNPSKKNDVLIVYPSNTDNAYNANGGRSSYTSPKGDTLSFKRPFELQRFTKDFLKWIPNQGFNVDYITDRELDDFENIKDYKVIIIPGHNEYWTRKARRNFDKFVDNGGDAIVLSGNTMWWQVRYSGDKMICYKQIEKDSLVHDTLKTSSWILPILNYPILNSIGADFTNGGFGLKNDKGWDGYKIINSSPLFDETGISVGDKLSVPSDEYDGSPLLFNNGKPQIDTSKMKFHRQVILGYDIGFRDKVGETHGTFIVFQESKNSGIIINTASTNWCSEGFGGKDGDKIKKLTYNFIDFLLTDKSVF